MNTFKDFFEEFLEEKRNQRLQEVIKPKYLGSYVSKDIRKKNKIKNH